MCVFHIVWDKIASVESASIKKCYDQVCPISIPRSQEDGYDINKVFETLAWDKCNPRYPKDVTG